MSADINNAIATATPFIQKWEGLGSKSAGSDVEYSYSSSQNIDPNTILYSYQDSGGVWTIGWGTTDYNVISSVPVKSGDTITKSQADAEIIYEISQKANDLLSYGLPDGLNDVQFAALISLAYNSGSANAEIMIDYINGASSQDDVLNYWKTFHIKDRAGNTLSGLKNRRLDETMMYAGNYSEIYSYYLRNQQTIFIATGAVAIGLSISLYLYFKYKNK